MLTFLSLPGIDMPLTRSISQGYDKSLFISQKLKFRLSLFGVPILLGFALFYFIKNEFIVSQSLLVAAIAFPWLNAFSSFPAFLTAKRRFFNLALISSVASIFFLIIHVLAIFISPQTVILLFAYVVAIIVPTWFGYIYSQRFVHKDSKTDPSLPAYGSFLTTLSVLPWISGNIGSVILAMYLGPETLAVYAVASRFLTAVQKNFVVFYKPLTAKLAAQSQHDHLSTLKVHWPKLLILGLGLAGFLWVSTPILIEFFFTKSYREAVFYGQVLSLSLLPLPLSWVTSDMIIYQKRKRPQIFMSTIPHLVKIVLYFLLLPKYGIWALIGITIGERVFEPVIPLITILKTERKK